MATDIIARGMAAEAEKTANKYKAGSNIIFTENADGTVAIEASGEVSSEDTVARNLINNHKEDTDNPHGVTAEQIGLGNVDNTSDLEKPISNAMQEALDKKVDSSNLGTAAYKDIPIDRDASDSQVVLGNDSRLSDSRKADGGNADTLETHPASDFVLSSDFEAHSGNTEIHVTSAEKAAWDGKAELTDIPTTLPADGGNADTVDGKNASDFMQFLGDFRSGSIRDIVLSLNTSGFLYCGGAGVTDLPADGGYWVVQVRVYGLVRELIATRLNLGMSYVCHYNGSEWYKWHNLADGGSAASVGAYTEAKIAALEARVAALEGK